jgi:hypothetical protein
MQDQRSCRVRRAVLEEQGPRGRALLAKAEKGDAVAAREYRAWLNERPADDELTIGGLTRERRQAMLEYVNAVIEEKEAAQRDNPQGT